MAKQAAKAAAEKAADLNSQCLAADAYADECEYAAAIAGRTVDRVALKAGFAYGVAWQRRQGRKAKPRK